MSMFLIAYISSDNMGGKQKHFLLQSLYYLVAGISICYVVEYQRYFIMLMLPVAATICLNGFL